MTTPKSWQDKVGGSTMPRYSDIKRKIRSENFPHIHCGLRENLIYNMIDDRLSAAEDAMICTKLTAYMLGDTNPAMEEALTNGRTLLQGALSDKGIDTFEEVHQIIDRFGQAIDRALERTLGTQSVQGM